MYVQDDTDIISFVAYALYKEQKSTYVERLLNENKKPSEIDKALREFANNGCTPSFIEGNKERATKLLALYQANLFNEESKKLIHNLDAKIKAVNDVVAPKSSLFRDIGVNLLANLAWVVLIALVAFFYNLFASEDFLDLLIKKLIEAIDKRNSIKSSGVD